MKKRIVITALSILVILIGLLYYADNLIIEIAPFFKAIIIFICAVASFRISGKLWNS